MGWFTDTPKHLPTSTGPYVPGMVDVMVDYSPESPLLRLYYPTAAEEDLKENSKKWISWIPDDSYLLGLSKVLLLYPFLLRLLFWYSDKVRIPALYGERVKTDEKLKVVVMSHGLGGCRFLYTNICCEMASRGFLVACIEHKDNSACSTFYYKNKEDAQSDARTYIEFKHVKLGSNHYTERNAQLKRRANECINVVDLLIALNNGEVPYNVMNNVPQHRDVEFNLNDLVGNLDISTLTMMGHSFGGATALYTMSQKNEIKQGILLDPWMFPVKDEELEQKVTQPILFINTQTFHIATNVKAMSKLLIGDHRKMYTLLGTTHENQSDSVLLIGYWLNWFMKKQDPLVALKLNNALIFTFLHKYIDFPKNTEESERYLEERKEHFEEGLTRPWA